MDNNHQENIEKASSEDFLGLQNLLNQANEYSLQLSNRKTWENVEKAHNIIARKLKEGNVFIIRNNYVITSSITLSETSEVWDELGKDGKALYFTKLMKDPKKAQPDEAFALLKFATLEAKKRKKVYLRCDAVTDNIGIVSYYKKLGFQDKGHVFYKPSCRQGILFEIYTSQLLLYIKQLK